MTLPPRPPPSAPDPCLDASDVAAFVDGRLPDDERALLLAHATRCTACSAWIGATAAAVSDSASSSSSAQRSAGRRRWLAVAAGLLVAGGATLGWLARRTHGPSDASAALATAARDVGVELLDDKALDERALDAERGALYVIGPRGGSLTGRPTIRWTPAPPGSTVRVTVRGADGLLRLDRTVPHAMAENTTLAWPASVDPLPDDATFVIRVVSTSATGETAAGAAFRVATPRERADHANTVARIESRAPNALRGLLVAYAALRAGLLDEARSALSRAALEGAPTDEVRRLRRVIDPGAAAEGP